MWVRTPGPKKKPLVTAPPRPELSIRNPWHLAGGKGVSQNTTCRPVEVRHADGRTTREVVTNDLGLGPADTPGLLTRLKEQGVAGPRWERMATPYWARVVLGLVLVWWTAYAMAKAFDFLCIVGRLTRWLFHPNPPSGELLPL